jgi:hypothetical protein
MTPDSNGSNSVGNGTYTIHAIAVDLLGQTTELGSRVISVDNAQSVLPFGTIDTPAPGQVASGTAYVNFGWALAPRLYAIPLDGSTIWVYIDNVAVGHPSYGYPRVDIQSLFPGLANTNTAIGYYYIDTTKLSNGLHQISWSVTDNAGHTTGIGSRFFLVQN